MQAKLKATDVNALIADYEHVKPSAELKLIQGALRLSSQCAGGRCGAVCRADGGAVAAAPGISGDSTVHWRGCRSGACPLAPAAASRPASLPAPELVRTLEGHSAAVSGVAVTPDGKRAVSASDDNTLKVWDLETGRALRTLEGPLSGCHWRGGDAGRKAGGFRV